MEIVRENEARIRRICRVYAEGPDAAEDLFQDVLVQLWRSFDSFRGTASRGTWVYRVALNTALSGRRSRRRRPEVPLEEAGPARPAAAPSPDRVLERKQARERLYGAIARLRPVERALVAMSLDGRSYREMAEVMGISESNVGVKLHRARARLAELVRDADATDAERQGGRA